MSLDRRKIISIVIILAVAALLGFLMYLAFFRKPPPDITPLDVDTDGPITGLPDVGPAGERPGIDPDTGLPFVSTLPPEEIIPDEIAAGGITRVNALSATYAQNSVLTSDGSLAYYNRAQSKFFKITPSGSLKELSSKEFYNVENVNWSSSGDRAVLEYPDGSKITYDFNTGRQYTLPKEWQDFSFDSSGDQIAFKHIAQNKENNWLSTASFDGSNMFLVEPLGENADKVQVNWSPTGQVVANYWESRDAARQEVYFVGLHGENFKSTIVEGRGFDGEWTGDGQRLLYSVYNPNQSYIPNLWIVNASGESIGSGRKNLGVNTWVDKCDIAGDNSYAYCAVPQQMPEGAGLYPELTYDIPDDFYRINLQTGERELLAQPYGDYTSDRVMLSPDGSKLYFRDVNSGRLYEIRLK
ncbi:hypothetical protein HQ544_00840 [Candidatus Falkowbacteria bacterium]|nr:hypothetical protein [Candidatus Falkowbacteria bacterium]